MENDDNNNENDETQAPETNPNMSETDMKDFIIRTVNAAVGGRTGRLEKKFEDMMTGLTDKLSTPAVQESKDSGKKEVVNPQIQQLQAALEEERQLRIRNEEITIQKETKNRIREAFEKHGVTGPRAKAAMAMLHTEDKVIRREDDGNVYFFAREKGVTDPIPLDLDSGIERFLGTEEGKMFLPPKNVGGSGTTGGKAPQTKSDGPSDSELLRQFGELMLNGAES